MSLRNWTGFCANKTNSMMSCHNSIAKLTSDNYSWVVVVMCCCLSIHLGASYACKKLTKTSVEISSSFLQKYILVFFARRKIPDACSFFFFSRGDLIDPLVL